MDKDIYDMKKNLTKEEIRAKIKENLSIIDEIKSGITKTPIEKLRILFGFKQ